MATMGSGPMLNAYPDSLGGRLSDAVDFLSLPELKDCFQSFYVLPSLFHSDLDRGFSVVDYGLDESTSRREDLEALKALGIDLKLDFVLNHMSVRSPQFRDILANGRDSRYADFFIDWNRFWAGHGRMTSAGYVRPDPEMLVGMFFRKPGLPLLMVRLPDGSEVPYWNTFYQEIRYPRPTPHELADLPDMTRTAAEPIARIVRDALDAGTAPKEIDFGPCAPFARASSTGSSRGARISARWTSISARRSSGSSTRRRCARWRTTEPASCGWTRSPTRPRRPARRTS